MNKNYLYLTVRLHLNLMLIGGSCFVMSPCVANSTTLPPVFLRTQLVTDSIPKIASLDTLNGESILDTAAAVKLVVDALQAQILSVTNSESLVAKSDTITTTIVPTKKVVNPQVKKLEQQIEKLKAFRQNESDKYYRAHKLLEHYAKSEATDLLLNVWHYTAEATRTNQSQSGLKFTINSKMTEQLINGKASIVLEKIAQVFVHTLQRHASIYEIALNPSDCQLVVQLFSRSDQLPQRIATILDPLQVPYKIQHTFSEQPKTTFFFQNDQYFQQQLTEWEDKEQRLNRNIRMVEGRIEKLKK